jgi:hypothetical protein
MSGITFDEFLGYTVTCTNETISAISNALETIRNPALAAAERWQIMADAYQGVFDKAYNHAVFYQGMAELRGDTAQAALWRNIAEANRSLALQKGVLANDAYVKMVANQSTAAFSKIATPLALATDGVQLVQGIETAIETGEFGQLGEASMSILTANLFCMGMAVILNLVKLHPLGRFVLFAIAAGIGAWAGKSFWETYGEDLPRGIADLFLRGINWQTRRDPLTLDLDGDGIESRGIDQTNPILFDHDGDGIKHATGWITADDGFLVLDRNSPADRLPRTDLQHSQLKIRTATVQSLPPMLASRNCVSGAISIKTAFRRATSFLRSDSWESQRSTCPPWNAISLSAMAIRLRTSGPTCAITG